MNHIFWMISNSLEIFILFRTILKKILGLVVAICSTFFLFHFRSLSAFLWTLERATVGQESNNILWIPTFTFHLNTELCNLTFHFSLLFRLPWHSSNSFLWKERNYFSLSVAFQPISITLFRLLLDRPIGIQCTKPLGKQGSNREWTFYRNKNDLQITYLTVSFLIEAYISNLQLSSTCCEFI